MSGSLRSGQKTSHVRQHDAERAMSLTSLTTNFGTMGIIRQVSSRRVGVPFRRRPLSHEDIATHRHRSTPPFQCEGLYNWSMPKFGLKVHFVVSLISLCAVALGSAVQVRPRPGSVERLNKILDSLKSVHPLSRSDERFILEAVDSKSVRERYLGMLVLAEAVNGRQYPANKALMVIERKAEIADEIEAGSYEQFYARALGLDGADTALFTQSPRYKFGQELTALVKQHDNSKTAKASFEARLRQRISTLSASEKKFASQSLSGEFRNRRLAGEIFVGKRGLPTPDYDWVQK